MSEELKQLKTAGFDGNFPNMNQTKRCYQNYINYYKCINIHGEDHVACKDFWSTYQSLCPNEWKQQWDTQREAGNFPGILE
ncbi:hypothetical protein T552_00311 [Pneumocystis carinii B80]|uniref:Cytochrome c oxidase subunit n=1 Tax=Pneumocystis carinii (strain B80) TaxID=1408658 RepID=A0A0W4ZQH2_PNEC8|nr:hypothetical protein T552_00311 [Pneumocystis carinii B80]KTW30594.1 hypothetical protein T552_00311 [Pneumocystis carinii B80]